MKNINKHKQLKNFCPSCGMLIKIYPYHPSRKKPEFLEFDIICPECDLEYRVKSNRKMIETEVYCCI